MRFFLELCLLCVALSLEPPRGRTDRDAGRSRRPSDRGCPIPRCAAVLRPGCSRVKDEEKDEAGCPKYPCGKLMCPLAAGGKRTSPLHVPSLPVVGPSSDGSRRALGNKMNSDQDSDEDESDDESDDERDRKSVV